MSNRRRSIALATVALLALVGLPSAGAKDAGATDDSFSAGRIGIPKEFKYAGGTHSKGSYEVKIEPGAEGPYFVISQKGTELVRELAIVQSKQPKVSGSRNAVHILTKDEHMVRIIVRHGSKRYLAYFETSS